MLFHFCGHTEQGVRTAARLFAKAALLSGLRANAWIPAASTAGNTVSAFAKLGSEDFERGPANPAEADFTILFEPSLLDAKQLREGSTFIINSREKPKDSQLTRRKIRVLAADAYEHAAKGRRLYPNLVMLGFLASQFRKVQLKALKQAVQEEFGSAPEKQQELEAGFRATGKR